MNEAVLAGQKNHIRPHTYSTSERYYNQGSTGDFRLVPFFIHGSSN